MSLCDDLSLDEINAPQIIAFINEALPPKWASNRTHLETVRRFVSNWSGDCRVQSYECKACIHEFPTEAANSAAECTAGSAEKAMQTLQSMHQRTFQCMPQRCERSARQADAYQHAVCCLIQGFMLLVISHQECLRCKGAT